MELEVQRDIYSVSRLNREVSDRLELDMGWVWVEGELSNLARPASGHFYFSLKDARAQVRCALFKNTAKRLQVSLENGQQVQLRARVTLYQPRGDYQLIVEHIEDLGAGALQRMFEATKAKLHAEGLFDANRKKPLPLTPACIGVITSASGAAVRDVVHVLDRRYPMAHVMVFPTLVQGAKAPAAVAAAIARADAYPDCDVLLLVRGGGSLEDLWAFNEEVVARAIANCQRPIVSGVGHEIDTTIADFVADARAPTPSAAAELVSPNIDAMRSGLAVTEQRLHNHARRWQAELQQRADDLLRRLQLCHPQRKLQQQQQRLDQAEARLHNALERNTGAKQHALATTEQRLQNHGYRWQAELQQRTSSLLLRLRLCHPQYPLQQQQQRLAHIKGRLHSALDKRQQQINTRFNQATTRLALQSPQHRTVHSQQKLDNLRLRLERVVLVTLGSAQQQLTAHCRALDTVSPLATLERGYAVARKHPSGELITSTAQVKVDDTIELSLHNGKATVRIETLKTNKIPNND